MRRHILLCGLLAGLLITVMQLVQYLWLVIEHFIEMYGALVAAVFAALGIWLGTGLTRSHRTEVLVREVILPASPGILRDNDKVESLRLTPRSAVLLSRRARVPAGVAVGSRA